MHIGACVPSVYFPYYLFKPIIYILAEVSQALFILKVYALFGKCHEWC